MAQTIKLKRSSVQNNTPSTSDLELGELAINTYDGKLFIKKDDGTASIVQVGGIVGTSELTDGSVTTTKIADDAVTSAKIATDAVVSDGIAAGAVGSSEIAANAVGISQLNVTDGTNGQALVTDGSGNLSFSTISSGGGSQNLFQTLAVSGQSNVVADSTTDTLTLAAGSGMSITTDASTDTITFTSTATGTVTEAFKTISISGQSDVVADAAADTLTLVAGSNMTLTTNASGDSITFASTAGSGTTGSLDTQLFNGDGTTTAFTLTNAPSTEDNLIVFIDGVYQNKDSFTISGTTLTMGTAPDNGTKLVVHHVRMGVPADGSITAAKLESPISLTGDFAVDTNVLKVDSTNNRVGINITTPSFPLDVVGNSNFTGNIDVSGQIEVGDGHLIGDDDSDNLVLNSSSGESILLGSNENIFFNTGATSLTSQGTTRMLINSTGKVGIGTSSPANTLHVNSTDAIRVPVGTTAQRPGGAVGDFRYNSTSGQFEGYTSAGWGAIAGSGDGGSSSSFLQQELTGDGTTTAFTLNKTVQSEDNLIVFNEGVFQRKDSYVASGTTITFDTAPANGNTLVVYQMEIGVIGTAPNINSMAGDGTTTTLTLTTEPVSENATFLTVDGVVQHKATYSVSGTTLTFSSPPPNGSNVECITFTNTSVALFEDTDGDTKIQVEESTDEDIIRFDAGGTEVATISSSGLSMTNGNISGTLATAAQTNITSVGTLSSLTTTGNVTVGGNLSVEGTTTTLNTATLDVEDKNITLNYGSGDTSASANGAGITVQDAVDASTDATILWNTTGNKFDFSHTIDTAGNIEFADGHLIGNDSNDNLGIVSSSGENIIIGASQGIYFNTGATSLSSIGATKAIIQNDGKVGIGTASPNSLVNIAGASGGTVLELQRNNVNTTGTVGAINFTASDGHSVAAVSASGDGDNEGANLDFNTTSAASTNSFFTGTTRRMRITSDGKVGIGQDNPSAGLDIVVSSGTALEATTPVGSFAGVFITPYDYVAKFESTDANAGIVLEDNNSNNNSNRIGVTTHDMHFTTNNSERMRIDSSGNIGIGISSVQTQGALTGNLLEIHEPGFGSGVGGTLVLSSDNTANGRHGGRIIGRARSYVYSSIDFQADSAMANGGLLKFSTLTAGSATTDNPTERMRIDSSGRLGIGTTDIEETVTIAKHDGGDGTVLGLRSDASFSQFEIKTANSQLDWGLSAVGNRSLTFDTNSSERMRINGSGDVLVGTTNGTTVGTVNKHLVVGSTTNNDEVAVTLNVMEGTNNRRAKFFLDDDNGVYGLDTTASTGVASFVVRTAGTERMRITSSGNVGIGQTNPGVKLEIGENSSSTNVGYIRLRGHNTLEGNIYKDSTYGLHFDTNSNNQPIRIDGSKQILGITGNVGIGTESPSSSAKLDVNGVLALKGNDFLDSDTSAHYIKAPTALYFYTNASDIALELKQNMLAEFRKPSSRVASFGLSDANDKYITFYNSSGNFDIGTHTSNRHYLYGNGDIPISVFTNQVERVTIDDKGIKQYNRFVSGTILPTAFVGCDSWYDLSGRYSTVVTSGNDLTSCTDASGEGRSTLIKNTVAVGLNNNASLEQFPSGIYGFRFDRASYITGTSHTSGYAPPTGTNARTLWCIIYNLQEISGEPINHFLHYGTNTTSQSFGIAFTTSSNEFGQHTWGGSGQEVDADTDIAGGFTDNGTTPRDVYVLFSSYDGGTGETRVYRGGMEGVSAIGSISINTGTGYALHVGSRINANNSDENCDAVIGEFGAFSRRLTTKEMDLMASSLLLRWS